MMNVDWNGLAVLVAAVCSGLSLLMTTINGIRSANRQAHNAEALSQVKAKVETVASNVVAVKSSTEELAVHTNGKMDQLLAVTKKAAHAEGMKEQKELNDNAANSK